MNYDTDEDIKAEAAGKHHTDGHRYSHPSYGMIRVHRYSGGSSEPLFGTEIQSNGGMSITIEHCEVTQDLGRNWYYGHKPIVEVSMSPVQYAEMISNPNSQGMPCTIKYSEKNGHIRYRPIDTVTEYVESKLESTVSKLKTKAKSLEVEARAILEQKGALKKADKAALMKLMSRMASTINSELPFYEESIVESIDRQKLEARVEIESYVAHAINKAGIDAINNPEALKLLVQQKGEDEE